MSRCYEEDKPAQALLEQAEAVVAKLNRRLARIGVVHRYSVLSHTSGRALDRRAARRAADTDLGAFDSAPGHG